MSYGELHLIMDASVSSASANIISRHCHWKAEKACSPVKSSFRLLAKNKTKNISTHFCVWFWAQTWKTGTFLVCLFSFVVLENPRLGFKWCYCHIAGSQGREPRYSSTRLVMQIGFCFALARAFIQPCVSPVSPISSIVTPRSSFPLFPGLRAASQLACATYLLCFHLLGTTSHECVCVSPPE